MFEDNVHMYLVTQKIDDRVEIGGPIVRLNHCWDIFSDFSSFDMDNFHRQI